MVVSKDILDKREGMMSSFWRGLGQLLRRAADGQVLIAAESLFRSEQFFWQTGFEIPFLRPMSVWVNATYAPSLPRGLGGEVMIHNRGRLKYEISFIGSVKRMVGPRFPYRIVEQAGRIIPFKEIAGFHAVVIVPWSPEICMLRHLFKMRMPIFVPELNLLRNLVHLGNMRFLPTPYNLPAPTSDRTFVESVHPFDPFLDTARHASDARGTMARAYWAEYSEYLLVPALQYFASSADLVAKLNSMEGQKISARMQMAYRGDLEEMRSFWRESLSLLLR
ncbi:unnamed protein product [Polarella glacialis]|uniref:Uncharacterized protein n=1 Tax=Polarella glacialis TaxID=89957 RepID=A0A813K4C5_POLGL|nr:unnamed protein product [Polarella glacialis]CAE8696742.1 unnamed protein product [Polarella glacialis]